MSEYKGHISKTKAAMMTGIQGWPPKDWSTHNFANCHIFKTALWKEHGNGHYFLLFSIQWDQTQELSLFWNGGQG